MLEEGPLIRGKVCGRTIAEQEVRLALTKTVDFSGLVWCEEGNIP